MKNSAVLMLEETSKRLPNKLAIKDSVKQYTFSNLRKMALNLASAISTNTSGLTSRPIAVYMPKNADCIVSFMGILYSGNFYVPLDTKSPYDRLKKVLENLEPVMIITTDKCKGALLEAGVDERRLIFFEKLEDNCCCDFEVHKQVLKVIDTDPIYAIYTSGSTGTPKGVVVAHRGVLDYIEWAIDCYNIDEHTIIGNQSPFHFDNSTLDIYLCISTGATLIVIPEQLFAFPLKLMQYLNENKISLIFWVPSVLINVANTDVLNHINMEYLKKVLFAGEVMPNRHLNYWRRHIPHALYSNLYGPTEITVDCTYYIADREFDDSDSLPIGFPCRNSDVIILSESGQQTKIGEIGELCVRGSSLALGYWNDPEKTAAAFVQNPLNKNYPERIYRTGDLVMLNDRNEIIFMGRKDSQIKHMGYRIELGEIENAVLSIDNIDNACALYNNNEQQIVLLYETGSDEVTDRAIRIILSRSLPKYMIPTRYIKLGKLPYNSNGKIDRVKLRREYIGE